MKWTTIAMELGPFEVRAVFSDKTFSPAGQPVGKQGGLAFPYLKAMEVQMSHNSRSPLCLEVKAGGL